MHDKNGVELKVGDWVKFEARKHEANTAPAYIAEIESFDPVTINDSDVVPGVYLSLASYFGTESFFKFFYNIEKISEAEAMLIFLEQYK